MTHPHRLLRAAAVAATIVVAVFTALIVTAGPVSAAGSGGESPAATESPAQGEGGAAGEGAEGGAEGAGAEGGHEEGRTKIQPPLGFDEPKELVGWGFLALTGLAGMAAAANAVKQLKGRRPQADGSWRPR